MKQYTEKDLSLWKTSVENQFFDRKSGRLAPKDLAIHLCAFANASGGTIVLGIEDDGKVTGVTPDNENRFRQTVMEYLYQIPKHDVSVYDIVNDSGVSVRILIFSIQPSYDAVIKTKNGEAYLRIGDQSRRLSASQLLELEYSKGIRSYESQVIDDATIDDLDFDIINTYVNVMPLFTGEPLELLRARGLIKKQKGVDKITVSGLLLFAKYPSQFLPSARVRFLRYEGSHVGVGRGINIVKDLTLDSALPKLLINGQRLLESQMREFQSLSREGIFIKIPEYPPFTWLEGLVNAVTHRDYSIQGDYIRISMFDDRMEFSSPGSLPSIVTVDNIQNTRFARNPIIARVLCDFGWVRELNEGVRRIYHDMKSYFLEPPNYRIANNNTVLLTLKNNIATRSMRKLEANIVGISDKWTYLKPLEKEIIYYLANMFKCTPKDLIEATGKSRPTITRYLKNLITQGLAQEHAASSSDPTKYYSLASTLK